MYIFVCTSVCVPVPLPVVVVAFVDESMLCLCVHVHSIRLNRVRAVSIERMYECVCVCIRLFHAKGIYFTFRIFCCALCSISFNIVATIRCSCTFVLWADVMFVAAADDDGGGGYNLCEWHECESCF